MGHRNPRSQLAEASAWQHAFTLIELLVVIAIIAILAAILLPVLDRAKQRGLTANCLNNMKQLELCYNMYVNDNNDTLPWNIIGGLINGQTSWITDEVQTAVSPDGEKGGVLFQYNNQVKIYACPANTLKIGPVTPIEAADAKQEGYTWITDGGYVPQVRTCAINYALGGCGADDPIPGTPGGVSGVTTLTKFNQIQTRSASGVSGMIVFVDQAQNQVNDGDFGIWPSSEWQTENTWWNLPADRHDNGATFSFADGHVEYWHWHGSAVINENLEPFTTLAPGYTPADPVGTSDDLPRVAAGSLSTPNPL